MGGFMPILGEALGTGEGTRSALYWAVPHTARYLTSLALLIKSQVHPVLVT